MGEFGVSSEVGTLRGVLLHRPGAELSRLTEANRDRLLFDVVPSLSEMRAEHDAFAQVLRERGVEVLLLGDLLPQAIEHSGAARIQGISAAVSDRRLGPPLAAEVSAYLRGLAPADLARVLIEGLAFDELPGEIGTSATSLVRFMHAETDFVIDPLPNLMFTRDSSFWVGDRFAITRLAFAARSRETSLTDIVFAHHPLFLGTRRAYESRTAPVEGGDGVLLAPGVVAVGVGERTTPAGVEALARSLFRDELAHTVLAVGIAQSRAYMHLGTMATMVDTDAMVMNPQMRCAPTFTVSRVAGGGPDDLTVTGPTEFADVASRAMGLARLRVIDTALDAGAGDLPVYGADGSNTLAVSPGVVIAYAHATETNRRLRDVGIEVLEIAGGELATGRGGPRCLACPVSRAAIPA
jgi:arginine deiminase